MTELIGLYWGGQQFFRTGSIFFFLFRIFEKPFCLRPTVTKTCALRFCHNALVRYIQPIVKFGAFFPSSQSQNTELWGIFNIEQQPGFEKIYDVAGSCVKEKESYQKILNICSILRYSIFLIYIFKYKFFSCQ